MLNISTDYDVDIVVEFVDRDGNVVKKKEFDDVKLCMSAGMDVHEIKMLSRTKYYIKVDRPVLWDDNCNLFKKEVKDMELQARVDRESANLPVVICTECEEVKDENEMLKVDEDWSVCERCFEYLEFRDGGKDLV